MLHKLYTEGRGPFANKIVRASMDFRSDGGTTVQVEVGLGADQVHWCQAGWTLASDRPRAAHTSDGGSCERER